MNNHLQQKIINNLQYFNSFQLSDVLDFVKFIKHKEVKNIPNPGAIDALCGKYRNQLSSSREFARRKKEEIKLEGKKWRI